MIGCMGQAARAAASRWRWRRRRRATGPEAAAAAIRQRRGDILDANDRTWRRRAEGARAVRCSTGWRSTRSGSKRWPRASRTSRPARSGRRGAGGMDAAERADDLAGARAARRHRHHLRSAAERDRRCRRPVPEIRQCRDPARRLREFPFLARASQCADRRACARPNLPAEAIQLVPTIDRAAVGEMLRLDDFIDIIVPRGGKGADRAGAAREPHPGHRPSRGHLPHLYRRRRRRSQGAADRAQRQDAAHRRLRRDRDAAGRPPRHRAVAADPRRPRAAGCEIRGDAETRALDPRVKAATAKRIGAPSISTRSSR